MRTVPSWLAKKRVVGGFVVEPIVGVGESAQRYFPSAERNEGFDLPVLSYAAGRAEALIRAKKLMLVFVPVYWACLDQARTRARYLQFLSTLSESARRLFVFELAGIPEDLMVTRIEERISQLRPYCRSIVCRTRIARRDFSVFGKLQVHAVGIDLGELPTFERGIIPAFDTFMDAVAPTKRNTYVHGLTSKSLLVAVQAAGVDFVAGTIIPQSDDAPQDIRGFEIADLYDFPKPSSKPAAS
ncbi:MAG TPA: hypothetical protein VGG27_02120 [Magnetospirillaceae bacterium]